MSQRTYNWVLYVNQFSFLSAYHFHLAHDSTGIRWTHHHEWSWMCLRFKNELKCSSEIMCQKSARCSPLLQCLRFSFSLINNDPIASHARASIVFLLLNFASYRNEKTHYFAVLFSACEANAPKHRYEQKPIAFFYLIYIILLLLPNRWTGNYFVIVWVDDG